MSDLWFGLLAMLVGGGIIAGLGIWQKLQVTKARSEGSRSQWAKDVAIAEKIKRDLERLRAKTEADIEAAKRSASDRLDDRIREVRSDTTDGARDRLQDSIDEVRRLRGEGGGK